MKTRLQMTIKFTSTCLAAIALATAGCVTAQTNLLSAYPTTNQFPAGAKVPFIVPGVTNMNILATNLLSASIAAAPTVAAALTNSLATTNYVNTATNGHVTASITNGVNAYVTAATNNFGRAVPVNMTNAANQISGVLTGNGAGITNIPNVTGVTNNQTGVTLNGNPPPYGNTASGSQAWTEGYHTTANASPGTYGIHAEGSYTTANGTAGAHAEGFSTTASGDTGPHAEGYHTTASGTYGAHAEGSYTTAGGVNGAHAEGFSSTASGTYGAHAEGYNTVAGGIASHAAGVNAVTLGDYSYFWSGDTVLGTPRTNTVGHSYNVYAPNGVVLNGVVIATNWPPPVLSAGQACFCPSNNYNLYWVTPTKTNLIVLGQ